MYIYMYVYVHPARPYTTTAASRPPGHNRRTSQVLPAPLIDRSGPSSSSCSSGSRRLCVVCTGRASISSVDAKAQGKEEGYCDDGDEMMMMMMMAVAAAVPTTQHAHDVGRLWMVESMRRFD